MVKLSQQAKTARPQTLGPRGDVCEMLYVNESTVHAVAAHMPDTDVLDTAVDMLKLLSDPTRVRIVLALARAELCVCDLAALLGLSISAVSHQLRILRHLGWVTFRKEGRLAYYSLQDPRPAQILEYMLALVTGEDEAAHGGRNASISIKEGST